MVSGIPNIIKDLSDDLKARIEAVVQLTEEVELKKAILETAKRDLRRVHVALEALNGSEIPIPKVGFDDRSLNADEASPVYSPGDPGRPNQTEPERFARSGSEAVPRPNPIPAPVVPVIPSGPICSSCKSGTMIYTSRSLNNGKVVNLWSCPECRNERL